MYKVLEFIAGEDLNMDQMVKIDKDTGKIIKYYINSKDSYSDYLGRVTCCCLNNQKVKVRLDIGRYHE